MEEGDECDGQGTRGVNPIRGKSPGCGGAMGHIWDISEDKA